MKRLLLQPRWVFGLLLAGALLSLCGCASDADAENTSARPWDSPRGWENGLPGGMTEGR